MIPRAGIMLPSRDAFAGRRRVKGVTPAASPKANDSQPTNERQFSHSGALKFNGDANNVYTYVRENTSDVRGNKGNAMPAVWPPANGGVRCFCQLASNGKVRGVTFRYRDDVTRNIIALHLRHFPSHSCFLNISDFPLAPTVSRGR